MTASNGALSPDRIRRIRRAAHQIRLDAIEMTHAATCGHPGGPLGMAEMLATLVLEHLRLDPKNPKWPQRDRFVLSNGHTCAGLYSILSQLGFFSRDLLPTFRKFGSPLQGHPHYGDLPGVEMATGSLGNGLSAAAGMALIAKMDGLAVRVYATSSDGENQEGQPWEQATSSVHYELDNLCVLLDWNNVQIDGHVEEVMSVGDLAAKWAAFGWFVQSIDGHDVLAIHQALLRAKGEKGRPSMIVCKTTLGKGVSFMENNPKFHGTAPNDAEFARALRELGPLPD
jgi:transketolase